MRKAVGAQPRIATAQGDLQFPIAPLIQCPPLEAKRLENLSRNRQAQQCIYIIVWRQLRPL